MDWLTFLSTDLGSLLSWPVAVVVAVIVLKRDVATLLRALGSRLQKAKGPWGELTFGQGVDEVEHKLPPEDTKAITESEDAKRIDDVSGLARLPPPYIVSQAWLRLEQAIRDVVDQNLPNKPAASARRLSPIAYMNLVTVDGTLSLDDAGVVDELRKLRNRAAHEFDPDITITDALRYNDIANSLIQKIEQHRRGQPPS
jgi:hypothetical protein